MRVRGGAGSGVLGKGRAGPAQASLGGLSPTAMPGGCSWWAREDAGLSGHRPSSCRLVCAPNPSPPALQAAGQTLEGVTSQALVGTALLLPHPLPPASLWDKRHLVQHTHHRMFPGTEFIKSQVVMHEWVLRSI